MYRIPSDYRIADSAQSAFVRRISSFYRGVVQPYTFAPFLLETQQSAV
jgi:hypothetical protein